MGSRRAGRKDRTVVSRVMKYRTHLGLFGAAALALATLRPSTGMAGEPLTLGIHPFLPSTELIKKFRPLADYLAEAVGRPVQLEFSSDYTVHIERIAAGMYDAAYMGPLSFVRLAETHGGVPLLAKLEVEGRPFFQGAIFVREESPIRKLEDLAGRRVAFVSPSSTMGYLVPRHLLEQAGVDLEELGGYSFLDHHENVALGVMVGDFDAGAVKEETFLKYASQGARALAMTPPIPEHLFVASSRQTPGTVEAMRAALLSISKSPEGRKALRSIKSTATNLVPVDSKDYDVLREILARYDEREGSP